MFYELPCCSREKRKSFYGKAMINEHDGVKELISYETTVCSIDKQGDFHRLWGGYSMTTMRHVNSFRQINGMKAINKHEWEEMEVWNNV